MNSSQCFNTQPRGGGWEVTLKDNGTFTLFQHTAARRRLHGRSKIAAFSRMFQHTATRRRLQLARFWLYSRRPVSTHSHPKVAAIFTRNSAGRLHVSTHSRAEAAASKNRKQSREIESFNTQPRGGGCFITDNCLSFFLRFNTQPREGGCQTPQNLVSQ